MAGVSVLMTIYNREAYLAAAIQSVLDSTYRDFELILVDDCSRDRSAEIAREFACLDSRVKLYVNSCNLGDYGNRMKAASLASGDYLKYVDSDDIIYPHGLEVMVRNMERNPRAAVAVAHSLPEEDNPYPVFLTPDDAYRKHFLGRGCFGCGPGGAIIRRSIFETLGGFNSEWGVLSDLEFWLRVAASFPILLQQPALTWWRKHEGQEYRLGDAARIYMQRGFQLARDAIFSAACPLPPALREEAYILLRQRHARRMLSLAVRQRKPVFAASVWRACGLSSQDFVLGLFGR